MIKVYGSGDDFISENGSYLNENRYLNTFFFLDSKFVESDSKKNYALKVFDGEKKLLAMRIEPFALLLYGDDALLEELFAHLESCGLEYRTVQCSSEIGDILIKRSAELTGRQFFLSMGMDFMECDKVTMESCPDVVVPNENDIDEIFECSCAFVKDCNLPDIPSKEKTAAMIPNLRIIRSGGRIASVAGMSPDTDGSTRIVHVYTRPEFRGKGYAKKTVNTLKNEILSTGKKATLNVDIHNPVSYHLYESLGFKRLFTHGVYAEK